MNRLSEEKSVVGRRGAKTREALLAAGRALFARQSFDAVTIEEIVNEAQVAKGSFYTHFADKDALLGAIVAAIREGIEERITEVNKAVADAPARLVRALCVYAAMVSDDPAMGHILLHNDPDNLMVQALNKGLVYDLSAGLREGRLTFPSVHAALLFVVGVSHSLIHAALRPERSSRMVAEVQPLTMLILRAFGLSHVEAELITAQAVDDIIRLRAFEHRD